MFRIVDIKTHTICVLARTWTGDRTGVNVEILDELKVLDTRDGIEEWVSYFDFCKALPIIIKDLEPLKGTSKERLLEWAKYVRKVSWRYNDNETLYRQTGGYFNSFIHTHLAQLGVVG